MKTPNSSSLFPWRAVAGLACLALGAALTAGCAVTQSRNATSVIDFLYPDQKEPVVDQGIPVLNLPMRVGVAFVPDSGSQFQGSRTDVRMRQGLEGTASSLLSEARKRQLLDEVGRNFEGRDFIRTIEIIPSAYLRPRGSFQNLDQLRTMYGIDVIALVSYDQAQFTDETYRSIAYWTIVGAFLVKGDKNSTHTMVDAVIIDIPSRKMLFRAPGTSFIENKATPINLSEKLRADAERGFEQAVEMMIANLDQELVVFQDRVQRSPEEYRVVKAADYKGGAGALGGAWLLALGVVAAMRRRSG